MCERNHADSTVEKQQKTPETKEVRSDHYVQLTQLFSVILCVDVMKRGDGMRMGCDVMITVADGRQEREWRLAQR